MEPKNKPNFAVIGAGISGLSCARMIHRQGFPVTVFEKSRDVGGRMSTRRSREGWQFDHGAQYFTARDPAFIKQVEPWIEKGIIERWRAPIVVLEAGQMTVEKRSTDRYVSLPGMNGICRHLAKECRVQLETTVAPPRSESGSWRISDQQGNALGDYDVVIVSAPPAQATELMVAAPLLAARARRTSMQACWAVLLAFSEPIGVDFGGAFVHQSPLSWIARNCSKPARTPNRETWILHSSSAWAEDHLEDRADAVVDQLTVQFWRTLGMKPQVASYRRAHRWRYALPTDPLPENCLFDSALRIGACGDWCGGPRVEGAYLSGIAAAKRALETIPT